MLNVAKCYCAGYSPLGDKIVLLSNNNVYILHAYTYQIMSVINVPKVRNFQFSGYFELICECNNGSIVWMDMCNIRKNSHNLSVCNLTPRLSSKYQRTIASYNLSKTLIHMVPSECL